MRVHGCLSAYLNRHNTALPPAPSWQQNEGDRRGSGFQDRWRLPMEKRRGKFGSTSFIFPIAPLAEMSILVHRVNSDAQGKPMRNRNGGDSCTVPFQPHPSTSKAA